MSSEAPPTISRAGAVVQVLSAAVGLGAYIVLAGGIAEWARMSGAGLPASQALSAYEPITLLASGFQTLLLVPLTLLLVFVAVKLSEDVQASPEKLREVRLVVRGWETIKQLVILYAALVLSLVPAISIVSILALASGSGLWTIAAIGVMTGGLFLCFTLLTRRAENWRERLVGERSDTHDIGGRVPGIVRTPFLMAAQGGRAAAGACAALVGVCLSLLASDTREGGLDLVAFRVSGISAGVLLAAFVAIMLAFTAAVLAVFGQLWLARTLRLITAEEQEPNEVLGRAKASFWLAALLLCVVIFVPLAAAIPDHVRVASCCSSSTTSRDGRCSRESWSCRVPGTGELTDYQAHSPQVSIESNSRFRRPREPRR